MHDLAPQSQSHTAEPTWQQQFELIHTLVSERIPAGRLGKFSPVAAEKFLGVTPKKWNAWARGQRPNAGDLEIIGRVLGLNPQWLLFGEGSPFAAAQAGTKAPEQAVPASYRIAPTGEQPFLAEPTTQEALMPVLTMLGKGSWAQPATLGLHHAVPHIDARWLAIQASDNSYAALGFFAGNIAYCNPHALPRKEEALFVQCKDGSASMRLWVGYADSRHICLRGCTANGASFFEETIAADSVRCLAPIIIIQKRI
jgi:hypothetical protein